MKHKGVAGRKKHYHKHGCKSRTGHHHRIKHRGHHGHHRRFKVISPAVRSDTVGVSADDGQTVRPRATIGATLPDFRIPRVDVRRCKQCGKCRQICPETAILLVPDSAVINAQRCVGCGACIDACPTGAITL